ncbi:MAG TPA: hypothetical protein DCM04_01225 [Saprospirales bacterium]|nr:hypothetical protein [Saprospirales bacterium]|tara:strand:+ start:9080 stop:11944 length:2865 start_codon:yes stop_codon:yes gene_type:complete
MVKQLLTILFFALIGFSAIAQQGSISGVITDEEIGETLISAYVYIEGTDIAEATDFDGKYTIKVAPGTYTLKVTYIGFDDKLIEGVEVKDGEVTYINVPMSTGSQMIEQVVVSAKAITRGENAVMQLQKKSYKIQDGISAQEMSKLASGTVASAMTKVTGATVEDGKYINVRGLGDRYSLTQLDGLIMPGSDPYRNSASLDLIPTAILDNVITSKTFTPDQPGIFIGGNVDVKTKSFPETQSLTLSLSGGFNTVDNGQAGFLTEEGGRRDWLGYDDGSRARPSILGQEGIGQYLTKDVEFDSRFSNKVAADKATEVVNAFDRKFDSDTRTSGLNQGISLFYGNTFETGEESELGILLSTQYKRDWEHRENTVLNNWLLFNIDSGVLDNRGTYTEDVSTESPTVNGLLGLAYKINKSHTIEFKTIYSHSAEKQGRSIFGEDGNNIEAPLFKRGRYNGFIQTELLNLQFTGKHRFENVLSGMEVEWSTVNTTTTREEPNLRFFTSQFDSESGREGIPLANVNDPFWFWRNLEDKSQQARVDVKIPLKFGEGNGNILKVGAYGSRKDRSFGENRYINKTGSKGEDFNGDFGAFFGQDNIGVIETQTTSSGAERYHLGNFIIDNSIAKNSYNGTEDVNAAYIMMIFNPIKNLKLVGGLRYESTGIFVQSEEINIEGIEADSTNTGSINISKLLPSVNAIYALNNNMNLRAGFNQTIARPNLREIAPFASFDVLTDEFLLGNPTLEQTSVANYDIRWEYFYQPGEILAVSTFYKDFNNPIGLTLRNAANIERQYINVESGFVSGIELEMRKKLNFLGEKFENFKITSNITFINSGIDVVEQGGFTPEDRPFFGQAPILANAVFGYDNFEKGFNISAAYNYKGDNLTVIGDSGTDVYTRAINTLDVVASKTIGEIDIRIAAKNLLNPDYKESIEWEGQEYISRLYKRGMDFSVSLSYRLL